MLSNRVSIISTNSLASLVERIEVFKISQDAETEDYKLSANVSEGTIGGWTITKDMIYSETETATGKKYVGMYSGNEYKGFDGSSIRFFAGATELIEESL